MMGVTRPGHRSPAGYDAAGYPAFAVTVDVVILTMLDGRLHVLLVRRHADPFAGAWALPGGFKRPDETLDEAAARELREETGVAAPKHLAQFGAYGDPGRDPRTNVVTVGYLAVTPDVGAILAGSDADEAQLWPVAEALGMPLAFDHRQILAEAIERAADQLEQSDLATAFVGPTFTLSELQNVYEELWDADIDPANFRRSLTSSPAAFQGDVPRPAAAAAPAPAEPDGYVAPTGERAKSSPRGGRPAELFRAGSAWKAMPPLRRPRPGKRRRDD
jgi:8-oxo-dGTP diphosphatase